MEVLNAGGGIVNRGINKEALTDSEVKGKNTRANPIRIDVLVPNQTETQITEISEAMKIEKAAIVRMLIWFALRFAPPLELAEIADKKSFKTDGVSDNRLDTRITQEMLDEIENLMKVGKHSKSSAVKTLLYWALANINNYTIGDWLSK
jgi:hypothetical protein